MASPDGSGISALDGIAALLDKSLLRLEEHPDGQARYVMLETVRSTRSTNWSPAARQKTCDAGMPRGVLCWRSGQARN